eukprot:29974-Pelagococcus_subviridis.AAC.12
MAYSPPFSTPIHRFAATSPSATSVGKSPVMTARATGNSSSLSRGNACTRIATATGRSANVSSVATYAKRERTSQPANMNAQPLMVRAALSFFRRASSSPRASIALTIFAQSSFIVVKFFCTVRRIALSTSSHTSSIAFGIGTARSSLGR